MWKVELSRLYFQCGQLVGPGTITYTTYDGGRKEVTAFINQAKGPLIVEIEGNGDLYLEHSPLCSVSSKILERPSKEDNEAAMKMTFEKVEAKASKSGKCAACGARCSRTEKFWQTLNPYNKTKTGQLKTADDIRVELAEKVEAWKKEPVYHASCE